VNADERIELRAWVAASRRRQGLPEHVTDPAVLALARDVLRPDSGCAKRKHDNGVYRVTGPMGGSITRNLPG
jgi:hypothetical protein